MSTESRAIQTLELSSCRMLTSGTFEPISDLGTFFVCLDLPVCLICLSVWSVCLVFLHVSSPAQALLPPYGLCHTRAHVRMYTTGAVCASKAHISIWFVGAPPGAFWARFGRPRVSQAHISIGFVGTLPGASKAHISIGCVGAPLGLFSICASSGQAGPHKHRVCRPTSWVSWTILFGLQAQQYQNGSLIRQPQLLTELNSLMGDLLLSSRWARSCYNNTMLSAI